MSYMNCFPTFAWLSIQLFIGSLDKKVYLLMGYYRFSQVNMNYMEVDPKTAGLYVQ